MSRGVSFLQKEKKWLVWTPLILIMHRLLFLPKKMTKYSHYIAQQETTNIEYIDSNVMANFCKVFGISLLINKRFALNLML